MAPTLVAAPQLGLYRPGMGKPAFRLTYPVQYANGTETVNVILVNTERGYQILASTTHYDVYS